ncbi:MAG: PTPDL family protein [Chthoniobacterales bacterium]
MKFPQPHPFFCLLLFLQSSWLMADTIVLKTGERLEAKITKTTDTTVEAEVKMSASITDVRVIQKADIASIEKPDPAEAEFAAVKAAGPGPNSFTPADYDTAIHTKINAFIGKYPTSPHVAEAREMIATLEKEKERVAFGEVKIENIWYTPQEVEKQKDQINATLLLQQMIALGQAGDSLGALNLFTKLEKTYPGTRAYPSAVEYAQQLIPNVQTEVTTKKAIFANEMIERKKGMELLPDFKKAPLIAAAASEEAKANAALEAAIKAGTKWTPIYPRNQKSLDELQKTVTAENTRLAAIKTAPMLASIAAVDEAKKQMAAGDLPGATASLQTASSLWSANLLLKDANAQLTLAKATPIPTPTPSPTPKGAMKTPLPRKP